MNVTGVPAQILFVEAEIETFAESPGFTVTGKITAVPEQPPTFGTM